MNSICLGKALAAEYIEGSDSAAKTISSTSMSVPGMRYEKQSGNRLKVTPSVWHRKRVIRVPNGNLRLYVPLYEILQFLSG
ncbi:hypothetical protein QUF76_16925 [Desulfobacterales bacterium HSG16]|nr:hypothetical protein [Desulfobacterales bacterium HSG16]